MVSVFFLVWACERLGAGKGEQEGNHSRERISEAQPCAIPYSETPFFRTMYFMRNGLTGSEVEFKQTTFGATARAAPRDAKQQEKKVCGRSLRGVVYQTSTRTFADFLHAQSSGAKHEGPPLVSQGQREPSRRLVLSCYSNTYIKNLKLQVKWRPCLPEN